MPNRVIQSGAGPGSKVGTEALVDALRGALRTSAAPFDHADVNGNLLGHYRMTLVTGASVSVGAAGILAYLRWSDVVRYLALLRVSATVAVSGAITAATVVDLGLYISRGSTAVGSGGAAATLTGSNGKLRSNMGSTLVTDMRVGTTGALTRPTSGTVDSQAMAACAFALKVSPDIGATASATVAVGVASPVVDLYNVTAPGMQHPIILTPGGGETVELQEITAGPTTGSLKWYLTFEWAELALF